MKLKFSTDYTNSELDFIKRHHCEIITELKVPKNAFKENDTPRRMLQYCGTLIAEIFDGDEGAFVWTVMSTGRFRGKYIFSYCCDNLEELVLGL